MTLQLMLDNTICSQYFLKKLMTVETRLKGFLEDINKVLSIKEILH